MLYASELCVSYVWRVESDLQNVRQSGDVDSLRSAVLISIAECVCVCVGGGCRKC